MAWDAWGPQLGSVFPCRMCGNCCSPLWAQACHGDLTRSHLGGALGFGKWSASSASKLPATEGGVAHGWNVLLSPPWNLMLC